MKEKATKERTLVPIILWIKELTEYHYRPFSVSVNNCSVFNSPINTKNPPGLSLDQFVLNLSHPSRGVGVVVTFTVDWKSM